MNAQKLLERVYLKLLREGGHAFDDVGPISLADFKLTWPNIKRDLQSLGCTSIEQIGSTGKKSVMGDIDLAASYDGSRDELLSAASKKFGSDAAQKVGANIVTIRYPVTGEGGGNVQVDVMLGDPKYLAWSRFGTSNIVSHPDYSPLKGMARNVLLNIVNRFASEMLFPGKQTELDRVRYSVDFDSGLYKVTQTKRNAKNPSKSYKDWKTVDRELVSSDPDDIAAVMFGNDCRASDLRRTEDVVRALRLSPTLKGAADKILAAFSEEMPDIVKRAPGALGNDPTPALAYIDKLVRTR